MRAAMVALGVSALGLLLELQFGDTMYSLLPIAFCSLWVFFEVVNVDAKRVQAERKGIRTDGVRFAAEDGFMTLEVRCEDGAIGHAQLSYDEAEAIRDYLDQFLDG